MTDSLITISLTGLRPILITGLLKRCVRLSALVVLLTSSQGTPPMAVLSRNPNGERNRLPDALTGLFGSGPEICGRGEDCGGCASGGGDIPTTPIVLAILTVFSAGCSAVDAFTWA